MSCGSDSASVACPRRRPRDRGRPGGLGKGLPVRGASPHPASDPYPGRQSNPVTLLHEGLARLQDIEPGEGRRHVPSGLESWAEPENSVDKRQMSGGYTELLLMGAIMGTWEPPKAAGPKRPYTGLDKES